MNIAHTPTLYACVHAADFPAQALLRLRPDLHSQPLAVLEGRAPLELISSLNRHARLAGAVPGMTRVEGEHVAGLRLLPRSLQTEAAARAVVFECAANFAPQIEDVSGQTACACVLDIAGTERLFGPPERLARNLRAALATAGFRASVTVSGNFHAARLKAAAARGVTLIAPGEEAAALATLPITLLKPDRSSYLDEYSAEMFANWGIRTLGELAALPESDLVVRLGDRARLWRNLALGTQPHTFQPVEAAFALEELCDLDTPVDRADSLLFLGARMIDCLAARAAAHALALASLTVSMALEGGGAYRRVVRPAVPTIDRKFLLKLLQLEFAAHPPQAAVLQIAISAEAGQTSKVQLGLFTPQTPEPSRLDVTIARLKAIAGDDRVGSPVLEDTNKPDSFHLDDFAPSDSTATATSGGTQPRAALRRMRPPLPVRVSVQAAKPVSFRAGRWDYAVSAAYGPWRTSGCWWTTDPWDADEWDVLADRDDSSGSASVACLLIHDRVHNQWRLEAFYD
ncbi:MAG TPA: DNA polymerase Y family protein [Terracidiphilus sp.]|nr:DNA polymerase Y family protein [Terracidiphilus sp.]